MKKRIILPLVMTANILLLTGLGGCSQEQASTGPAIGVVTLQDIYSSSKVGTAGVAFLEGLETRVMDRYVELSGTIEKAREDGDEALQERLQVEMQAFAYSMQNLMTTEQERVVAVITENVEAGMAAYRQSAGLSIILASDNDMVQSFDTSLDVTPGVLQAVDAIAFDFGEYPPLDGSAGQVESSVILPDGVDNAPAEEVAPERGSDAADSSETSESPEAGASTASAGAEDE